jgi:hypothetical protein
MRREKQKPPVYTGGWSGNVLVSHGAAPTISSELKGLTAAFGMGTGVSLSGGLQGAEGAL